MSSEAEEGLVRFVRDDTQTLLDSTGSMGSMGNMGSAGSTHGMQGSGVAAPRGARQRKYGKRPGA